jgi:hypothetical protein
VVGFISAFVMAAMAQTVELAAIISLAEIAKSALIKGINC